MGKRRCETGGRSQASCSLGRAATTGVLCALMALPGNLWAASAKSNQALRSSTLTEQQKTLQVLNRFTFGPRPGEAAAVDRMGLEAWFEQQLQPQRIDDSALDARLARYPAMRLSQAELVAHYPTPEMLRRYTRGGLQMPDDATERVIYADAAMNYAEKRAAKEANKAAQATPGAGTAEMAAAPVAGERNAPMAQEAGAAPVVRVAPQAAAPMQVPDPLAVTPMAPAEKDAVLQLPPAARLQRLFALSPEQMTALQAALRGPENERLLAGLSPEQREDVEAMKTPERMIQNEVLSTQLLRDVYSQRELQAVMNSFWLNHFSVFLHKNQNEPYLLPAYDREAVLPNALGHFEDLLVATAESPAMLVYLDNAESIGPDSKAAQRAARAQANNPGAPLRKKQADKGINENYARELMELHTLGVKGGYTQQDVIEVAKCFTGWTIDRPAQGGEFLFNPNRHEPGDKVVLGHTIHEGGMKEGLEVLHILATSPATAHFISMQLAQRFVSDTPPPALVDRMAQSFLKSDGDMKAVLLTMFHSPEFWSPAVYRAKVKTPVEFVASALRATDAEVDNPTPLLQALDRLGMPVYGMQTPNGYSWLAEDWVSSNALLTRMNFALVLSGNRLPGTHMDLPALLGVAPQDVAVDDQVESRLEMALLGQPAAPQTREAAMAHAQEPDMQAQAEQGYRATPASSSAGGRMQGDQGAMLRVKAGRAPLTPAPGSPLSTGAGLLLGSPDFQRR